METADFLRQLDDDGVRLAEVLTAADLDAPVPGLDWTVGEVAGHLGGVHRWAADLVRERRAENSVRSAAFMPAPDVDVVAFSTAAHRELVDVLRATPDDAAVWGFGRSVPAQAFWARRQAHETAVHRGDVEAGAGRPVTAVGAGFAQDGLAEVTGFARGFRSQPSARRLGWVATDAEDWVLTFLDGRIRAERGGDVSGVDATVTGSSSDLYLWAWNRPAASTVTAGDPAVPLLWQNVRVS